METMLDVKSVVLDKNNYDLCIKRASDDEFMIVLNNNEIYTCYSLIVAMKEFNGHSIIRDLSTLTKIIQDFCNEDKNVSIHITPDEDNLILEITVDVKYVTDDIKFTLSKIEENVTTQKVVTLVNKITDAKLINSEDAIAINVNEIITPVISKQDQLEKELLENKTMLSKLEKIVVELQKQNTSTLESFMKLNDDISFLKKNDSIVALLSKEITVPSNPDYTYECYRTIHNNVTSLTIKSKRDNTTKDIDETYYDEDDYEYDVCIIDMLDTFTQLTELTLVNIGTYDLAHLQHTTNLQTLIFEDTIPDIGNVNPIIIDNIEDITIKASTPKITERNAAFDAALQDLYIFKNLKTLTLPPGTKLPSRLAQLNCKISFA